MIIDYKVVIIIPFTDFHAGRVEDPGKYKKIVTKDLGDGIQLLLGVLNEDDESKTETQSYHFDKDKWTPEEAKKWLKDHDVKTTEFAAAAEKSDVKENETYTTHVGDVVEDAERIDALPQDETDEQAVANEEFDEEHKVEWTPEIAKQQLIGWATDEDGTISKKSLMKWFLDVDGGNAQDVDSYRYVAGAMIDGEPRYCSRCLDSSWDLASGKLTGIANRSVMKKIIFVKEREGMPLTEDQLEFTQRHMSVPIDSDSEVKLNESILEDANEMGNVAVVDNSTIRLNSALTGSKVIYEDDNVIDVPVIPMREGVFTGTDGIPTLKMYEHFGGDAHWLEGQPILKGHTGPTELVTYRHNRIGKLMNVIARPDKKDVVAVARYYKNKLSPDDITRIKSDVPYDGSIAYTTHTSMTPGEYNGSKYNAVEDGGYHFYHFAELANGKGACSHDEGCGFLLNEAPLEEMKENSNYWTAPVKSHLVILDGQLSDLKKQFAETNDSSLEVQIDRLTKDIASWTKQLSKLNPKENEFGVDKITHIFKNRLRTADVIQNGDDYKVKLNSGFVYDAKDVSDAESFARKYVQNGMKSK